MAGIQRIVITNGVRGRGAQRFKNAKERWPAANVLYRKIFDTIGCPLAKDDEILEGTKEEIFARTDRELGIDLFFNFRNGMRSTCQEKIRFPGWGRNWTKLKINKCPKDVPGVSFDYAKRLWEMYWNKKCNHFEIAKKTKSAPEHIATLMESLGIWREYYTITIEYMNNPEEPGDWFNLATHYYSMLNSRLGMLDFHDWALYDYPSLQRETCKGNIKWDGPIPNTRNGARASFMSVDRNGVPDTCLIAKMKK